MKRILILITAAVLCSQFLGAQNYAKRQLEYIGSLMTSPPPTQSSVFNCSKISSFPLKVEYDTAGTISHLGFSLFADSLKKHALAKPLYDFQERLFLEVFLQGDETKARKLLNEYKVQWTDYSQFVGASSFFNSLESSLHLISQADEFVMTKDSLAWTSSWQYDNQSFVMRFPANFDLISGMDKKEAEIWLAQQLQNFQCNELSMPSVKGNMGD
ncbi:MAG: hypothetical protein LBN23_00065, partial [Paludibacter sp.]|nr:hypothetical protein [Paludibacter sp.]